MVYILLYSLHSGLALHKYTSTRASDGVHQSSVLFAGPHTARVSAFVDDITVFICRHLDIKAVAEYERIAGAKINFDKSESLRLGAWRGSDTLPMPFRWSDRPVRILWVWFEPDLQLERNWPEVQVKVDAQVGTWLPRRLSLKDRVECASCTFSP